MAGMINCLRGYYIDMNYVLTIRTEKILRVFYNATNITGGKKNYLTKKEKSFKCMIKLQKTMNCVK